VRCYWEHHWGTRWELKRNMLGTKEKWKKKTSRPRTLKLGAKAIKALWVHAEPSHWLHEIFISKTVCHHFWPGLKTFSVVMWFLIFCTCMNQNCNPGELGRCMVILCVPCFPPFCRGKQESFCFPHQKFYKSSLNHIY